MGDRITLTGIRATGHHGVYAKEREDGQEFVVDAVLELDLAPAGRSDDVVDTAHYGEAAERIAALIEGDPVNLIERLASLIAEDLLAAYPLDAVEVTVHKPAAPIPVPFADVAVTLRRERA